MAMDTHKVVLRAEQFAKDAHKGQLYGGLPFIIHPRSVVHTLLLHYITHSDILAAAWLHDVVEDTSCTHDDIEFEFGPRISHLVYLLTDKPGKNRRERHENTYCYIMYDEQARIIKIADRLSNVLASLHSNDGMFGMYKAEHDLFKEYLYREPAGDVDTPYSNMQTTLDTLLYRGRF